MRHLPALTLLLFTTLCLPSLARSSEQGSFKNACSRSETWEFPSFLSPEITQKYKAFVAGQLAPIQGFAQGIALRTYSASDESKLFGEFWVARALYESKLHHTAHSAFLSILNRGTKGQAVPVFVAALECYLQLLSETPALSTLQPLSLSHTELRALLETLGRSAPVDKYNMTPVLHRYAAEAVRIEVSLASFSRDKADSLLSLLRGSGAYEALSRGLVSARLVRHDDTITHLETFLNQPGTPEHLVRYKDHAHLLIARALYARKRFTEATTHFKAVKKSSNELVFALSELTWAHLLNYKYGDAIGTALTLQTGSFKRTFSPEAPMVMAMAMNELCQYPDSVRAIHTIQRHYEPSHKWLTQWSNTNTPLYPAVVEFLRKTNKQVPDKVASEWVRSPVFISHQDEMNRMIEQLESVPKINRATSDLQLKLAQEILLQIKDLKPRFKIAKMQQKVDTPLPKKILDELSLLRQRVLDLKRLQRSAPIWARITDSLPPRFKERQSRLIASINRDLASRSQRMLLQLEEVIENTQLIEVEIFSGASQDIIWQNANPDFKKLAAKLDDTPKANAATVWNWGSPATASDDDGEIWEDELGSFQSNVVDNCTSKDKYLALKKRGNL